MDGSDSGTPNPLNPMSSNTNSTGPSPSAMPEANTVRPVSAMPEMKEAVRPVARPNVNHNVVDPMMRSVQHHSEPSAGFDHATTPDVTIEETFDTLTMDDNSLDMLAQDIATTNDLSRAETIQTESINTNLNGLDGPELVAKDSIVEPAGKKGGKKKTFLIGAIVFLMLAVICGVAAAAVILLGNSGDRISKAIEKVISGEMPNIITVQGNIKTTTETENIKITDSVSTSSTEIDFDGTFDTATNMNKISADVAMSFNDVSTSPLTIEEMRNKVGDTYFKISGLTRMLNSMSSNALTSDTSVADNTESSTSKCNDDTTKCLDVNSECTGENCTSAVIAPTPVTTLSSLKGLLEAADNTWILISDEFGKNVEDLDIFDNTSACLINAFSTLPNYSKDIMNKYKANPFIASSTENLGIAKKNGTLYRLTFDNDKLSAFVNSLGNNGFINELNACTENTASNDGTSATMIEDIFSNFPTMYAEVDDNNNFTRFYFQTSTSEGATSSATTADITLSYPKEFKISEPTEYITMSQLLTKAMSDLLTTDATPTN